ncbi:hypothetical protein [Methyloceanibacter superfactus]|nr:hypothetical protein [Methyloceanibacter superfactus]
MPSRGRIFAAGNDMYKAWMDLAFASAQLWREAQEVMMLRTMKIALGDAASHREAQRMVMEKGFALAEAMGTLAMGGSMHKVVGRYRSQVRANKRRLTR